MEWGVWDKLKWAAGRWGADVAQGAALLAGWSLLLHGTALLTGTPRVVWTLGGAVLVLGLVGYRFIWGLFVVGLYTAAHGGEEGKQERGG